MTYPFFSRAFAGLALFLLMTLSACGSTPVTGSLSRISSSAASYPPVNTHYDVDRFEFTTPSSMCSAILVAEVVGVTHGTSHWNTPDGLRPPIADAMTLTQRGYRIYTVVQFSTVHALKDSRTQPTQEFTTLGGIVGEDHIWFDSFPQLRDSDHYVIVFAPGSQPLGKGATEAQLTVYNAFPVDVHGMVLLQQAGSPKELGPGKPQPEVKIALTDLQHQLATCH